jgi:pimeloyl-ACP methyl ester carboxylesterase
MWQWRSKLHKRSDWPNKNRFKSFVNPATSQRRGPRYWLRLLAVAIVWGVSLLYAGYLGIWVYATAHPARTPVCCIAPADLGLAYEDVALTAVDGVTLFGWCIPSHNKAAVILLHGYGANRAEMVGRAGLLADHGYGVLLYDQRASGESEGEFRSFGWADVDDVPVALEFLVGREGVDPERVGALGFSQGGQIALRAAAESDRFRAVVAEEPGFSTLEDLPHMTTFKDRWIAFNYRLGFKGLEWWTGVQNPSGVVEGLSRIAPRSVLLIATGPDEDPGYWLVRHFYDKASEPKTWWHVPEAGHGQVPLVRGEEYRERIVSFFDKALLQESD